MARAVRLNPVLVAVLVATAALLGCSGPSVAASAPPGPIALTVAPGQRLAAGTYEVTVTSDGRPVALTIVSSSPAGLGGSAGSGGGGAAAAPPQASGAQAPAPATAGGGNDTGTGAGTLILVILLLVALAAGAAVLYLRVLGPRRYVRAYRRAVAQMEARRYDLALPALTKIETTLPDHVRGEARFFIAFALYRLDDLQAAEYRLAELHRENAGNADVAYFLAFLRAERREFDGAETVLEALAPAELTAPGKLRGLYGLVKTSRAFAAFRDGRIDAAAELFEEVERLGDFAGHIPIDLRNRNVMVGAKALFDRDVPASREQFEALRRAALQTAEPRRSTMLASAELGLALGAWLETDDDAAARTERLLAEALRLLDPDGALTARWPDPASAPDRTDRVEAMMIRTNRPQDVIDQERTVRDVHFLRGMALLRGCAESDRRVDGHDAEDPVGAAVGCFARARELDPEFSDVHVVVGLLRYYLATDDAERRAAVTVLREAQTLGTRDPEVLQILNQDDRVRQANQDAATKFLQVLDRYVADATVRADVREALLARMARHSRVRDWDTRPELSRQRIVAPTVDEMCSRSELLRARVSDLLQNQAGSADLSGARDLTVALEAKNRAMAESARAIEEQEAALLALLGDTLLSEVDR